ncbi:bifunctional indole-3-glycerol-phosphate synthase TrpC/phosphoribosylanthranilate isomerase TrpF [Aestuariibacter sp. AA17]|uniref:Multifunctional fusion protein n=1 Tax=Fluctibacter corallii TaxID=2984329 RepID=A0ABT3A5A7_9ALTE|nr:bifunctional indole-3-glycerol-phosphate synthase TrpC/phosphoribosylanthranilate isomerase TrpF [Aestuariibacter sp. AA17]MCV2883859.1 bifunctional indole-3-glycerol-phosphate synthase TrpC/phosphoribosylanthranilate isomerase TrpF [Aestuariibacter sp. AA17]
MANVLENIVADKRQEIAKRKSDFPLDAFKQSLAPSNRSFYDALNTEHAGFIFECKKASPSKGLIRERFDLDEIIHAYSPHAACISVLTDEKYFQGKFAYLPYVRERLAQPVLNKDFFVDPYQVYLARYYQADAILLMLSVLSNDEYIALAEIAHSLNLDILTEVSNEEETYRAIELGANIIGINNRNLRDLSTNLAMTEHLAPIIKKHAPNALIISESGIYTHQDVLRLAPLVNGFLVGSSLMAETDLDAAVRALVVGDIKICGITREEDAEAVVNSQANYAGLIFAKQSLRAIAYEQAKRIVERFPFRYVGVFVNEEVSVVAEHARGLGLYAVQLHGNEDEGYRNALKAQLPSHCQIWQAIGVESESPDVTVAYADRVLLDCKVGNQSGGTGQQFDWALLPQNSDLPLVLAGGLNIDNIVNASQLPVNTLDVNSGVEDAPGHKSASKINSLFSTLRQY